MEREAVEERPGIIVEDSAAGPSPEVKDTPHRIASIDGLRALAILFVMVHHYTPWIVRGNDPAATFLRESTGWMGSGVDLFFVLSGFLITGILVDSKGSPNYFARFYWRRSLRIFPAYYVFLTPLLLVPGFFTEISRPWFLFYLRNWRGADAASDGTLGHLWSLAVEEQFYIGWSIVVFLVAARWLPHITVALIALAPAVRAIMGHLGYPGYDIFRVTPARMDSLLLGALVALTVRSSPWKGRRPAAARLGVLLSVMGLIALRALAGPLDIGNGIVQVAFPLLTPLLYASTLALCLEIRAGGVAAMVLTNPFLRAVAKYSYAMYLYHLICGRLMFGLYQWAVERFPAIETLLAVLFIPIVFAVVFGLAAVSWRYLESPALDLKERFFRTPCHA